MLHPDRYMANTIGVLDRRGHVTVAREPVACVVSARWEDGSSSEHEGVAVAWTADAVEVRFQRDGGGAGYRVWVGVEDVRRGA